jgi:hypothetical protein
MANLSILYEKNDLCPFGFNFKLNSLGPRDLKMGF